MFPANTEQLSRKGSQAEYLLLWVWRPLRTECRGRGGTDGPEDTSRDRRDPGLTGQPQSGALAKARRLRLPAAVPGIQVRFPAPTRGHNWL